MSVVQCLVVVFMAVCLSDLVLTAQADKHCQGNCIKKDSICNKTEESKVCDDTNLKCCLDEIDSELNSTAEVQSTTPQNLETTKLDPEVENNSFMNRFLTVSGIETDNSTESLLTRSDTNIEEHITVDHIQSVAHPQEETTTVSTAPNEEINTQPVIAEERSGLALGEQRNAQSCPGLCVPTEYSHLCEYVLSFSPICGERKSCCISAEHARRLHLRNSPRPNGIVQQTRIPQCPGSCVHPSYTIFCDKILRDHFCPNNAKCCRGHVSPSMPLIQVPPCTGVCLPPLLSGICLRPYELMVQTTNCPPDTICCNAPVRSYTAPTSFQPNFYPSVPHRAIIPSRTRKPVTPSYHLPSYSQGQLFQVGSNGQITPVNTIRPEGQFFQPGLVSIGGDEQTTTDEKLVLFGDPFGSMHQQFLVTRNPSPVSTSKSPVENDKVNDKKETSLKDSGNSQGESSEEDSSSSSQQEDDVNADSSGESVDDTISPDSSGNEEQIIGPNATSVSPTEATTTRPPCPGSCMSSFLRFTCFRNYAIYDGFFCPGRAVCCAPLKDIEEHEQHLKSLSPYSDIPPPTREPGGPPCGVKGRRDTPRVVGGKDALPGEWCWQIAVINMHNQYICGGALIDKTWVLTAAHCITGPAHENQALFIRAGVTDLTSVDDNAAGQTRRVISTFVHHNHNSISLDNDIALLRLQDPVELNANVCLVCLPARGLMPSGDAKCTVTGYGFASEDGPMSLKIRESQVPVIDDFSCATQIGEQTSSSFVLPTSSFCAGGKGGSDACQGDAGGPLVCEVDGYYELIGLVSWGLGCGHKHVPSVYVRVPAFMGWVNQIISASSF